MQGQRGAIAVPPIYVVDQRDAETIYILNTEKLHTRHPDRIGEGRGNASVQPGPNSPPEA